MITIIEGVDGTGKTTFAKRLAEERGAMYLHADKPVTKSWFTEYIEPLSRKNIVCDRWHLGEIVWPTVFKRPSLFNAGTFDECNRYMAQIGCELIVLTRSDDGITRELLSRGEGDQVAQVLDAKALFVRAYNRVKYIPKRIIDSEVVH